MHHPTSRPPERKDVLSAVQKQITPVWADLPATYERLESESHADRLTLAFYRWRVILELADYAGGGVLVTASLAPSSLVLRTIRAIGNPGLGGSTVIAREVVRNLDDVPSTLERLGYVIRRHRSVAPFLAGKWRERGVRVGS